MKRIYHIERQYDTSISQNIQKSLTFCARIFDGCYIIHSEVTKELMPAAEVVSSYKSLELVERAFRNLKTVQLEVRPVYHKTDD